MIKTAKYIRKPLYVDAVRITEENFRELALWCQGEIRTNEGERLVDDESQVNPKLNHIHIRVHMPKTPRQTRGYLGDWVLYTNSGYKIYTARVFKDTFTQVDEGG